MLGLARTQSVPLNALAFLSVVAVLVTGTAGCGSEGSQPAPTVEASATTANTAEVLDNEMEVDAIAASKILSESTVWATTTRVAPAPYENVERASNGVVVGTVVDIELGTPRTVDAATVFGDIDELPGATFEAVLAYLVVDVEDVVGGAELEALLPGETVAVPVAVWFSGAGAPQRDDVTADVVTRLRDAIPQGARLAVHAAGIDTAGAVSSAPELLLPEMVGLPTPAAITFEASNGNLVNLDWLVADDAETYLGVTSFDELVERAAQQ